MSLSIQPPYPVVNDTDGQPLENGYIWIGAANLPPITNPISIYWDAALTQPAAQPVRTQGGYPSNAGTPGRLYTATNYSILVQNSRGVTLYSAPQQTELYGTASGGTGLTSYVVGDLLYADGTASLARLADVATGNVLRSGGVATAPAWGKVDLTTDVTGVLPAANGGTGLSAPGTSGNVLSSDGTDWQSVAVSTLVPDATDSVKGVVELATNAEVQAGTDSTRAVTPFALRKTLIVSKTATASTSGLYIDFDNIPIWARRITVIIGFGVSTNGTSPLLVQIGTFAGGLVTSGYASYASFGTATSSQYIGSSSYNGFVLEPTQASTAAANRWGTVVLINSMPDSLTYPHYWMSSSNIANSVTNCVSAGAGALSLSDTLYRIRITTVSGADTFDAGIVNVLYE